jgi:hypothetical protein
VVDGIRTLALRPKPIGVLIPCRLGNGLQCLPRDRLSCPVGQGRERQRALLAVLLREIDPCQGCRPITPPSAAARDRLGFLRWGVLESPSTPGVFCPVFSVTRLTARARAAHAWTTRELRRLTWRQTPA